MDSSCAWLNRALPQVHVHLLEFWLMELSLVLKSRCFGYHGAPTSQHKKENEVILCWNTQLLALWQHVVTLSPFVKLTNQLSLSYTSRLRALHCRFSRQKFPQWAWCLDRTGVITHCSPLWHDGPSNTIIKTHGFSSVSRDQSDSSDLASAGIVSPCQRRRDCGCFSFFVKIHISNKK